MALAESGPGGGGDRNARRLVAKKKKRTEPRAQPDRPQDLPGGTAGFSGRKAERALFAEMLAGWEADRGRNIVVTGEEGVGKSALLDGGLAPVARDRGWLWLCVRVPRSRPISGACLSRLLLADLSVAVAGIRGVDAPAPAGDGTEVADVRGALGAAARALGPAARIGGIVCAFDNAHLLAARRRGGPDLLDTLLRIALPLQGESLPVMLALCGLPGLWRDLAACPRFDANVFAHAPLGPLTEKETRTVLRRWLPALGRKGWPGPGPGRLHRYTGGYPHLLGRWCRELAAAVGGHAGRDKGALARAVRAKVDIDAFGGHWGRATPRERELLALIAAMPGSDGGFALQELVRGAEAAGGRVLSGSNARQILVRMQAKGLLYPEAHGKYRMAVPMLGDYVRRRAAAAPG